MDHPTSRGACPTLASPMPVVDGLLARFRPVTGFSAAQVDALARAAGAYGNGRIEVTARGSVQVRGLSARTEVAFREALDLAGIAAKTGIVIELSPVAGEDPGEIRDPRPLASMVEAVCTQALERAPLAPKLSIVIEGGGQVRLDAHKADIRLTAFAEGWAMAVGGRDTGLLSEAAVPDAVADVLRQLQAMGPRARGSDVAKGARSAASPLTSMGEREASTHRVEPLSIQLKDGRTALRITLPYGQVLASRLSGLAAFMEAHGVAEARPAPGRTLALMGACEGLSPALAALGFAAGALTLCSGAEAGDGGIIHAADLARAWDEAATDLSDGSFHLHVSTCVKGCAYGGRPGIVLSGAHLMLYGEREQKPFASLDPAAIETGLVSLADRIRNSRRSGETVLECLKRNDAIRLYP
ncbi:hypothetical protein [Pelagibacterium limicola]|uniref:hypothetical protein n=1 Tax=Pelagibacterium limicola TaxID=2791022 RepID=UPI0018AFAF59|nr:hypothetical protein [Pelagibacterium limicola]